MFLDDGELRESLAEIRSALTEHGRFVFETRNPLVQGWEAWTPDNAVEFLHGGAKVRMTHEIESVDGDLVSFSSTNTSPKWERPEVSRSKLRFLGSYSLSSFLSDAGSVIKEQFG